MLDEFYAIDTFGERTCMVDYDGDEEEKEEEVVRPPLLKRIREEETYYPIKRVRHIETTKDVEEVLSDFSDFSDDDRSTEELSDFSDFSDSEYVNITTSANEQLAKSERVLEEGEIDEENELIVKSQQVSKEIDFQGWVFENSPTTFSVPVDEGVLKWFSENVNENSFTSQYLTANDALLDSIEACKRHMKDLMHSEEKRTLTTEVLLKLSKKEFTAEVMKKIEFALACIYK